MQAVLLGVDIGTSSSKGIVTSLHGAILKQAVRQHSVIRRNSLVEMDGEVWWQDFYSLTAELLEGEPFNVQAIAVSGMGPCAQLVDQDGRCRGLAALYGVDARSSQQIDELNQELGTDAIFRSCDSMLTSQAVGPKLRWFKHHRPHHWDAANRFHSPASLIVERLTGEYVFDRQTASQCTPLYDAGTQEWNPSWWATVAEHLEQPRLGWAGEQAGCVTPTCATALPHLPAGTPVAIGTIDAWAEQLSVGADHNGTMLMYGTTMFLISNSPRRMRHPALWGTTGLEPGTWNLAGGTSNGGSLTAWLKNILNSDFKTLGTEARQSPPGSRGLLMLPYLQGERTPILDPQARATIVGLDTQHSPGDIFRAGLEAVALGVADILDTMTQAGAPAERLIAVGGGTSDLLWPQIITDVCDLPQDIPSRRIGASLGDAMLAAKLTGAPVNIAQWNPTEIALTPQRSDAYAGLLALYRDLYTTTRGIQHALASRAQSGAPLLTSPSCFDRPPL